MSKNQLRLQRVERDDKTIIPDLGSIKQAISYNFGGDTRKELPRIPLKQDKGQSKSKSKKD